MAAASIIASIVTGGANNHATVSSEANATATDFITQGVLGTITNTGGIAPTTGSFGVNQNTGSDMAVSVLGAGNTTNGQSTAYITCTPTSQDIQVLRARMPSNSTGYVISANASGSTKYDWIYLQANAANAAVPDSAADNVVALYTSRSTSNTADNGSPPTYGVLLAIVTVANGATAITNANITDKRTQLVFTGSGTLSTAAFSNPYKFNVSLSGNQTVSASTWTKASLATNVFDTSSNFDHTTNFQFTAPVTGFYQFNGIVGLSGLSDGDLVSCGLNVGSFSSSPTYQGGQMTVGAGSTTAYLTINEFISLTAAQTVQLYGFTTRTTFTAATSLQGYLVSKT